MIVGDQHPPQFLAEDIDAFFVLICETSPQAVIRFGRLQWGETAWLTSNRPCTAVDALVTVLRHDAPSQSTSHCRAQTPDWRRFSDHMIVTEFFDCVYHTGYA